ncbi:MAG: secretin N-terminal domain-containing protein, partial [Planctomycetota bacterium]
MQARIFVGLAALYCGIFAGFVHAQGGQQPEGVQTQAPGSQRTLLTLKLKDRLFKDVVATIRRKVGVNIIMDEGIDETVTIDLEQVEWRTALDMVAEKAGCVVVQVGKTLLKIEKPPRVFFAFNNAPIQEVIDTIAKISGANIVVAPEVQGQITLRLKNIPWRDALEAASKTLGYAVVEEDRGILRVVPRSNLQEDLVTRSFQLRYVRPASHYVPTINSQYVQNTRVVAQTQNREFALLEALRRALTAGIGQLDYFERSNVIIVKDTKPVIDEIEAIIAKIDIEPGQVFIDIKFVTTADKDILEYGIDIGDNGWTASVGLGQIPTRLPFNLGNGGFDDWFIANDGRVGPFADGSLNPTGNTTMPDVIFGALNFTEVTAALRLLKQEVKSEITQAPKLIALDHQEATIFVGETVRYAQARSEQGQAGGLQLVVEEAPNSPVQTGFQLLVIPHIVPGTDKIIMDLIPQSDSLSGTGQTALAPEGFDVFTVGSGTGQGTIALPRVSSATLATQVLLQSG